jgi:hypothetical protein
VKVLQEQIEHHVEEEEKIRDNIFQQARAADVDLEALGEQMAARKAELMARAEAEGLPPAEPATMTHGGGLTWQGGARHHRHRRRRAPASAYLAAAPLARPAATAAN